MAIDLQNGTHKTCPYCYSRIHYRATRCSSCTANLAPKQDLSTLQKAFQFVDEWDLFEFFQVIAILCALVVWGATYRRDKVVQSWEIVHLSNSKNGDLFVESLEYLNCSGSNWIDRLSIACNPIALSMIDLRDADISWANLNNATFFEADLRGTDFSHSMLRGAKFWGAELQGAVVYKADFTGARFIGANVENVDFTNAILTDALFGCNRHGQCTKFNKATKWPNGFNLAGHWVEE